MISIYIITPDRINTLPNGVTVNLYAEDKLITTLPDQHTTRPCIDGDVLSIQADGSFQGRVAGSNGPYEVARISASRGLVYTPDGKRSYLVPYVAD